MSFYQVRFSVGANYEYVYPPSTKGVVWKSVVYHFSARSMIGETDADIKEEDKELLTLKPEAAKKLIEEYRSSFPESKDTRVIGGAS